MKLKIHPDYLGLCGSCRHSTVAKTTNNDFLARCDYFESKIRQPIVSCSKYDDRRMPSLHEMRQTAWILRTDENRKAIGFISNTKWRRSREFRIDPDWFDDED